MCWCSKRVDKKGWYLALEKIGTSAEPVEEEEGNGEQEEEEADELDAREGEEAAEVLDEDVEDEKALVPHSSPVYRGGKKAKRN